MSRGAMARQLAALQAYSTVSAEWPATDAESRRMAGRPSRQPRPSRSTRWEPSLCYQQHQPAQRLR